MYIASYLLPLLLSLARHIHAASDEKPAPKPCTIHSPSSGSFIDMRPLSLHRSDDTTSNPSGSVSSSTNESYHARGHDYPYNFTLNFCAPVVEKLTDVLGVRERLWANVSAFYRDSNDDIISIGSQNSDLLFRGKKLLLNYTMGSPCPDLDSDGRPIPSSHNRRAILDDDDDDSSSNLTRKPATRHKTTLLSFSCDLSPTLSSRPAITFLGTPDHCTYIFDVRSRHACGGTTTHHESGTLGPGGVFLVITGIALMVYVIGGVVYQRNVMHQRGWRQLPNYGLWAGVWSFFSVCAFLPHHRNMCPLLFCSYSTPRHDRINANIWDVM